MTIDVDPIDMRYASKPAAIAGEAASDGQMCPSYGLASIVLSIASGGRQSSVPVRRVKPKHVLSARRTDIQPLAIDRANLAGCPDRSGPVQVCLTGKSCAGNHGLATFGTIRSTRQPDREVE